MNVRVEISEEELNDLVKKFIKTQFPNNKLVADAVAFESKVSKPDDPKDPNPEEPAGEGPVVAEQEEEFTWEPVSCRAVCELTTAEKKPE